MSDDIHSEIDRIDTNIQGIYNQLSKLREENERLRDRIDELETVVDPDPERTPDTLTKAEKVRKLRKALIEDALGTGRAAMKYDEVRALFDMSISPAYSYDLMKAAARMDGFEYDTAGTQNQGQKRIRVDMDAVNDETLVHSVKKGTQSLPA